MAVAYRKICSLNSPESYVGTVSNSGGNTKVANAALAQLVEQRTCNAQVVGSIPTGSSKLFHGVMVAQQFLVLFV